MVASNNVDFVERLNLALDRANVVRGRGRRTALAKMMKMSGEAARKWLSGDTMPSMDNAAQFATQAGVQMEWLLTGRGEMLAQPVQFDQPDLSPAAALCASYPKFHPIITWDKVEDLPEGRYVIIPRKRVQLSAGNGHLVFEEEDAPGLAFTTEWARQTGVTPRTAVVVYAKGDSMEPKIHDGDILLIDRGRTEVHDGEVYALRYGHEVRVKRLYRRYDGALILRSDNTAKYSDEVVPPEHQDGHVSIIGQVVWRAGDV